MGLQLVESDSPTGIRSCPAVCVGRFARSTPSFKLQIRFRITQLPSILDVDTWQISNLKNIFFSNDFIINSIFITLLSSIIVSRNDLENCRVGKKMLDTRGVRRECRAKNKGEQQRGIEQK